MVTEKLLAKAHYLTGTQQEAADSFKTEPHDAQTTRHCLSRHRQTAWVLTAERLAPSPPTRAAARPAEAAFAQAALHFPWQSRPT